MEKTIFKIIEELENKKLLKKQNILSPYFMLRKNNVGIFVGTNISSGNIRYRV